ncbi:uncharacterized protein LOC125664182 isoform X2 [Ostrea edulis]|uniref:uncharacterized protein LOC125664182 isoform X2 n=1 Tax=Ostrea edulis TaxID=37623 RepID=UPI0024AF8DD0|nr:uncharacterized protein LOC125664182 isoform X2 [Ostrea edulis]
MKSLLLAVFVVTACAAPIDEIQQLPELKPRQTAQQLPDFPEDAKQETKPSVLTQRTKLATPEKEELTPETKPSVLTQQTKLATPEKEELTPETKPSTKNSEQQAEIVSKEDLEPETKPVQRIQEVGEVKEPQTKPARRNNELKPETKPAFFVPRPVPQSSPDETERTKVEREAEEY